MYNPRWKLSLLDAGLLLLLSSCFLWQPSFARPHLRYPKDGPCVVNADGDSQQPDYLTALLSEEYDPPTPYHTDRRMMDTVGKRELAFPILRRMEDFKTEATIWSSSADPAGRSTLERAHYLVVPTWYDGDSRAPHDMVGIDATMEEVSKYYRDMSWGRFNLSWTVLEPIILHSVTKANATLNPTKNVALEHIKTKLNLRSRADFTGVVLLHSRSDTGHMRWGEGFAHVNGNFVWTNLPARFGVIRHEIGHNLGHQHHLANGYDWRMQRGKTYQFDGYTMMAGGNGYSIADFHPASKWHYNWIPDEAIVLLQPEGASLQCPSCLPNVSGLVLTPFDDPDDLPSPNSLKAVHIPVMGNEVNGKPNLYSYWLSYRGHGNDGEAAGGLSIHATHFQLRGMFAATFNSLNFDAHGDTKTTEDSFVLPNTCYVVAPPALFMDQSPEAVEQVQPIVCVDDLKRGRNITISVSFLNLADLPANNVTMSNSNTTNVDCVSGEETHLELDMHEGLPHLLHFQRTGLGGLIHLSMCSGNQSAAEAYFFDS